MLTNGGEERVLGENTPLALALSKALGSAIVSESDTRSDCIKSSFINNKCNLYLTPPSPLDLRLDRFWSGGAEGLSPVFVCARATLHWWIGLEPLTPVGSSLPRSLTKTGQIHAYIAPEPPGGGPAPSALPQAQSHSRAVQCAILHPIHTRARGIGQRASRGRNGPKLDESA